MSSTSWVKGLLAAAGVGAVAAGGMLYLTSNEHRAEASAVASKSVSGPVIRASVMHLPVIRAKAEKKADQAGAAAAERPAPRKLVNGATIGVWKVRCEAVAVNETACVLAQQLLRPSDRAFIAEILAGWNDAAGKPVLIARVPLGVHLPSGFVIQAKGDSQRNFQWQRCLGRVCEAALVLEPEDVIRLEQAGEVIAAFRPAPKAAPFAFRFSMAGLGEGLRAIHADPASLGDKGIGASDTGKNE